MLSSDFPGRNAIIATLAAVARELRPLAASFFQLGDDGEIQSSVVHGGHLPPASLAAEVGRWKARLRGIEPLAPAYIKALPNRIATARDRHASATVNLQDKSARRVYREIGAVNDARLLIRENGRLTAGVTLWRALRNPPWTSEQLARLAALQPLAESTYLADLRSNHADRWRTSGVLSPRQTEVAALLAAGATTPEIARALCISPNTAKSHVGAVLAKLGVASRREALIQFAPRPCSGVGESEAAACTG